MPSAELQKFATDGGDPAKFKSAKGYSLTWAILSYAPDPNGKEPTSFRFLSDTPNPVHIANAIVGPKGKDGKFDKTATIIQPEYITDCTCKVNGGTATGVVSFKAGTVYEGKVEYTARKKGGAWRIEEFRLTDPKITLALGADGKWVKK
jgi:hypothetical protein